ncbi:MAG: hypothetical protein LIP01_09330 [Tannerellaceae bacterium]|nr:hypothetical protein [Tannerellaceae bacterium]
MVNDKNPYPTGIDVDPGRIISQVLFEHGQLFISYYDGGCILYDIATRESQRIEELPAYLSIFSLYAGSQQILWVGTDGQGLFKVYEHTSPFHTVTTTHPVRAFCTDEAENLLVGTKGEGIRVINRQNRETIRTYTVQDGLLSNSVYAIEKNRDGDIFTGTEAGGINILYKNSQQLLTLDLPQDAPFFKAVYSICFTDNDSLLWLGTSGYGLIKITLDKQNGRYQVKEVEQYASSGTALSLNNNVIYSIVPGFTEKELWLGTRGGGVSYFDRESNHIRSLEEIDPALSLTSNDVLSLVKEDAGIWIGTSYGLNLLSKSTKEYRITEYTEQDGLPNTTIHGILTTGEGDVWLSTNQGLSHINSAGQVVNYSAKDGLQNDEFSDGAYFCDENHIFYFGGVEWLQLFPPGRDTSAGFRPGYPAGESTDLQYHPTDTGTYPGWYIKTGLR